MKKAYILAGVTFAIGLVLGVFIGQLGGSKQSEQATNSTAQEVAAVNIEGAEPLGDTNAPVKIIEYADLLCPYCAKGHAETFDYIKQQYIDTGKVSYELRLVGVIKQNSTLAGSGAYCAAEQGKYWDYVMKAYAKINEEGAGEEMFAAGTINQFASDLNMDSTKFAECISSARHERVLSQNHQAMKARGQSGTPLYVINGTDYAGYMPLSSFTAIIDSELQ